MHIYNNYFLLLISGCGRSGQVNKQIPELVKAEKVMFDHPDSALHILEKWRSLRHEQIRRIMRYGAC